MMQQPDTGPWSRENNLSILVIYCLFFQISSKFHVTKTCSTFDFDSSFIINYHSVDKELVQRLHTAGRSGENAFSPKPPSLAVGPIQPAVSCITEFFPKGPGWEVLYLVLSLRMSGDIPYVPS
jgi:hypothetical protein